jgi:hypothetical protein
MKKLAILNALLWLVAAPVVRAQAQAAAPATRAQSAGAVPAVERPVQPSARNVRFDITVTEGTAPRTAVKTLTLMLTEGLGVGSIRNNARMPGTDPNIPTTVTVLDKEGKPQTVAAPVRSIPLNVDVRGMQIINDSVRATVSIEYQPYVADARTQPAEVSGTASMAFQNGKKETVIQTVDPVSGAKTLIDVTATILK